MIGGVRVDAFTYELHGGSAVVHPEGSLDALHTVRLPLHPAWAATARLVVRVSGVCELPFDAALAVDGATRSAAVPAGRDDGTFDVELALALRDLATAAGARRIDLLVGGHPLQLARLELLPSTLALEPDAVELRDATDALLVDAPERPLFDLQNPEEGFWTGTGTWRLRLVAEWAASGETGGFVRDALPADVAVRVDHPSFSPEAVREDPSRRSGGALAGRAPSSSSTPRTRRCGTPFRPKAPTSRCASRSRTRSQLLRRPASTCQRCASRGNAGSRSAFATRAHRWEPFAVSPPWASISGRRRPWLRSRTRATAR